MSPAKRDNGSEGVGGLDRAAAILGAFDSTHRELTLAALVARSGLPRSTTHRVADRMIKLGWLDKPKDRYRVGNRLFEISSLAPIRHELREAALPFLQDLHAAAKTTVQLGVLEGTQVLVVERITGHRPMPMLEQAGGKIPAHCSALGRAILAYSDPDTIEAILGAGLPAAHPPHADQPGRGAAGADRDPAPGLGGRPGRGQHRDQLRRGARLRPARPGRGGAVGHRADRPGPGRADRPRRPAGRGGGVPRVRLAPPLSSGQPSPAAPGSVPMGGTGICLRRGTALTL